MKVFGVGPSRTGTASLPIASGMLGLKVIHNPKDKQTLKESKM